MALELERAQGRSGATGVRAKRRTAQRQFVLGRWVSLFLAAALPVSAGDYEQGLSYHQDRDFVQSLALFRRAAEQGDARAQFSLAYMYAAGRGVSQDYLEAHKWAAVAEANGHEHAANLLRLVEKNMSPEQLAQAIARERQPAVATAPTPTSSPAPGPAPAIVTVAQAVSISLEAWRAAWSRRDADAYLAAYAPDFKLPGGLARAQWEALRRKRLARAARIEVRAENPSTRLASDGSATVRFTQVYESDVLKETVNKTLVFGTYNGNWLIREETSAP
jgi:hypothetical protein